MSLPLQPQRPSGWLNASRRSLLVSWYGLVGLLGLGFGLLSDRRPFGQDILVHPLVLFFALVGLVLLAMRVLMARPVPEVISDRALVVGCFVGIVAFLAGNFISAQVMPMY